MSRKCKFQSFAECFNRGLNNPIYCSMDSKHKKGDVIISIVLDLAIFIC